MRSFVFGTLALAAVSLLIPACGGNVVVESGTIQTPAQKVTAACEDLCDAGTSSGCAQIDDCKVECGTVADVVPEDCADAYVTLVECFTDGWLAGNCDPTEGCLDELTVYANCTGDGSTGGGP
ncbi:MAG: hypothetical protein R3B70_14015 [Polyangiaceae bacterium]